MDSSQPLSIESLARENENLKYEIAALKSLIEEIEKDKNKSWGQVIDEKVKLGSKNSKTTLISVALLFEAFGSKYEIDVLPDAMEKASTSIKIICYDSRNERQDVILTVIMIINIF